MRKRGIKSTELAAVITVVVALLLTTPAHAANVTLKTSDAMGTSSFVGATNWSDGAVPSSGNAYFTGAFTIRTTNTVTSGVTYPFNGASLSVDSGGRMLGKIGNNSSGNTTTGTITGNFILNGGNFEQAGANSDNAVLTVAGSVTVNAASGLGSLGGTANGSSTFETMDFTAPISGSAALQVSGASLNAGADTGVVRFSAANPYGGTISVSNGVNNIIASTANRILQLNHVNALSNATLNLSSTGANPVSFTAASNQAAFNIGALTGKASQALADTAGSAITLSVGGNNTSSAFIGSLTGPGALVKTGSGVLTLSGANTYSGGTTIAGGVLQAAGLHGTYSGSGTVILISSTALTSQMASTNGVPFTGQWVVAGGWLGGTTNGVFGTNNITVDPLYPLAASAGNPPLAGAALFEPGYDLNSAGTLILTNGGQIILHQNCAFAAAIVEGVSLTNATYSYSSLVGAFPHNFAAGGAGFITVQPYGTPPPPPPQLPQFLSQPVSQTNFTGMTAQLTASVYGNPPPSFQWQAGAAGNGSYTNILNGGRFTGAATATLAITGLTVADAGNYILVASNSSGSVTSSPAFLDVQPGPAMITNQPGLSVSLAASGVFTISSSLPAWTFSGSVGQLPSNVAITAGSDANGGYSELHFGYSASAAHSAAIRLYTIQPVVLFSDTALSAGMNDLAFPHLTAYPTNLYHESYQSVDFSTFTFSQLPGESPWIFFDTNFNCFILSPATNYMVASDKQSGDGSFSCGINPTISQLPAGFTHRTVLTIQTNINQAFDTWGAFLTGLSGKVRPANDSALELNKLGYWTDNGAAYYYSYVSSLGYTGTLFSVRDQFATNGFPLGYLQLDSWWYPKGMANTWQGDATNNRGGLDQYVAESTLFPSGLTAFQQQLGLPLITHCRWVDGASPYRSQHAMSGNVIVDSSYWTNRMAYLSAGGVITFEHDWLDVMALPLMNLNDPPTFMNDMAASAAANGINLQYCMGLPRHFLQGSLYKNLLTMRVSPDRFEISKWNAFLYESRLAGAIGAWPWTDVYYSSESRNLLLGTLSGGPVGVGDALGGLNVTNLAKSVRPDGVIVKPDAPLIPTDQSHLNDAGSLNLPMVAATYVNHGGLLADYVFAYAQAPAATNASFIPSQLGITGPAYVYNYFNHTGLVVTAGSPFNFNTTMPSNNVNGSYFVVVPIGPSGVAFLGDTNKFVTLGKKRISALTDAGVIQATVSFAPGETNVTLTGYAPSLPYAGAMNGSLGGMNYDPAAHLFSLSVTPINSQTATVALSLSPLPVLQITNLGASIQISWPTSAIGYQLENRTTFQASGNWTPVTNPVSVIGSQNSVGVTPAAPATFYRLKQ
jgi:autotransporter-associated beta strand protein